MYSSIHNPRKTPSQALEMYWQALRDGWRLRLRHFITRRSPKLRDFDADLHNLEIQNSYSIGMGTTGFRWHTAWGSSISMPSLPA